MNIQKCDACGAEYQTKKDGGGQVALGILPPRSPDNVPEIDGFMSKLMGTAGSSRAEEYRFDLCYECALTMALALKKQKADLRAGRRPV